MYSKLQEIKITATFNLCVYFYKYTYVAMAISQYYKKANYPEALKSIYFIISDVVNTNSEGVLIIPLSSLKV